MKYFVIILLFVSTFISQAQFQARKNYGAMLEPNDLAISGAGQSHDAFGYYWDEMSSTTKPALYMYYIGLAALTENWYIDLKEKLNDYPDYFLIPQIGLSMTEDGTPSGHYEHEVAAGKYEEQIHYLTEGLKRLGRPAYLRIGYEFNGVSWNGYQPATYVKAFQIIAGKIKKENLEVATVWCFAVDGVADYEAYYPGDRYVDWCGIDMFSYDHFTDSKAARFTAFADAIGKPVMIGESTPRYVGVTDGLNDWNTWFVPYFDYIQNNPGVKAFCYINWDWSAYPRWSDWGDARLEQNAVIAARFNKKMTTFDHLNAGSEADFRKLLHPDDNTAPEWRPSLAVDTSGFPYSFRWNQATDASSVSHYFIYKNGIKVDRTSETFWQDFYACAGDAAAVSVQAIDRAGNKTPLSASVKLTYPDNLQKINNGSFADGKRSWTLGKYSSAAAADFSIKNSGYFSDTNNAHITITSSPGTNWQIFFKQPVYLKKGFHYAFSFEVKANAVANADFVVQHSKNYGTIFMWKNFSMNTDARAITYAGIFTENSGIYNIAVALGTTSAKEVWLDRVAVVERAPGAEQILR